MSYNIDTVHEFGNLPFAENDTNVDNGGKFVTIGADGQVTLTAEGAETSGVLRGGVSQGFAPAVAMGGFPYVVAEADLTYGDKVAVGAAGGARVAGDGDAVVGVVVQPGTAGSNDARIKLAE